LIIQVVAKCLKFLATRLADYAVIGQQPQTKFATMHPFIPFLATHFADYTQIVQQTLTKFDTMHPLHTVHQPLKNHPAHQRNNKIQISALLERKVAPSCMTCI
jgi:hypothetical protein